MRTLLIFLAMCVSLSVSAQIDLSRDPNKPAVQPKKSNVQLLKESQQPAQSAGDTDLSRKYKANNLTTPAGGMEYGDNGRLNQQTNQIKGTKATTTIRYDNSGKVQGSGTTIQFGKNK